MVNITFLFLYKGYHKKVADNSLMKNGTRKTVMREREKPFVARVDLPMGKIRLIGVVAAAKWLGCAPHSLSSAVKGVPGRGNRLRSMALQHFPDWFGTMDNQ